MTQTTLDPEIEQMADAHWEIGRGLHRYLIIEFADGWALREFTHDSVMPPVLYPTKRRLIARLMQLMGTGPVAPQTWPEEHCVSPEGIVTSYDPAEPA